MNIEEPRPITVEGSSLPDPEVSRPGNQWVLVHPYTYDDGETSITIPAGFHFDLASVPRWLWPITAPFELSIVGPLLHDYMYSRGGQVSHETIPPKDYTRFEADRVFREAMQAEDVPRWRSYPAWLAVRVFGRWAWRS